MLQPLHKLFGLLILVSFFSCSKDTETLTEEGRPHDPWVFRSVIDDMPRAITFALDKDLWVAYSAKNASLYKAWKGVVDFDGAVYTSAHGPQPKIVGDAYIQNAHAQPWVTKSGSVISPATVNYKGHRMLGEEAELMFDVISASGKTISVTERPEAIRDENGVLSFERTFTVSGLSGNEELGLMTNFSSIVMKNNIETNGNLEVKSENEKTVGKVTALEIDGILWMNKTEATRLNTTLATKPLIENPFKKNVAQLATANEGLTLISKSDCRTCHNINSKTVGPSYMSISRRYASNDENKSYLAGKIKAGGSGVWGNQVMTAHPDLPQSDLDKMVTYILGLVPEDQKENTGGDASSSSIPELAGEKVNESNMILGVLTKTYNLPSGVDKLPDFSTLGRPIQAGIMPNYDNINDTKFTDLVDNFGLTAEGYIKIEEDMSATFRMWSDDGSKLYIDEQLIVDHDGNHGVSSKEGTVSLKEGYHPFKIEYYNGLGGKFLSFNWKPEKASTFEIVPAGILYHDRSRSSETQGLSLPMSIRNTIPGDKTALTEMHPSFDLSMARPNNFTPKVGGMDFLPDGRLAVSTWDAEGGVYLLTNAGGGGVITPKRIASGLAEPLGLKVVDGNIYIMQKQELTKLVDTNGDDIIDEYITVTDDWDVSTNFHEFGFGLEYQDGYFYGALATAILPGGASKQPQIQDRGKVVKINKETGEINFVAQGLRTPNGIGEGVDGELFIADNQGDWLPASKIVHVSEGAFFGGRSVDFAGTANLREKKPVVWLPQDEIGNSPSTPSYLNVGPYKGQMIHGEVTHGGIKRVFVEKVNGEYQGALFRFMQGLEAGVNRVTWGPGGQLFMGGIGNPGNWQHTGKNWYGLQRMKYNEKSTFEMLAIRAKSNGIEIEFTEPLKEGDGWNTSEYEIRQWYYKPTAAYGGPKLDNRRLTVRSANVSADRTKVFLELAGMKRDHVIYVHLNEMFVSEKGNDLWSTEAWYTMNNIPSTPGQKTARPSYTKRDNTLTPPEVAAGWELLFDGNSLDNFRNFNKQTIGKAWEINDGAIMFNPEAKMSDEDGGDIITKGAYDNFEFELEWKIGNCGNSGIMYFVNEDGNDKLKAPFHSGPEMQVLDDICHPDTKYPTHRAGDLYDLIECKYVTVKQAGSWNKVRIVSNNGKMEHWQNGRKVVEFTMFDDNWKRMVANSKFVEHPLFGTFKKGHIALQDHGDPVWFKNIKIKKL